eukprot:239098-Rhodomonas_salina.2
MASSPSSPYLELEYWQKLWSSQPEEVTRGIKISAGVAVGAAAAYYSFQLLKYAPNAESSWEKERGRRREWEKRRQEVGEGEGGRERGVKVHAPVLRPPAECPTPCHLRCGGAH